MQPVIRIEEGYILHAILARGWVGGPSNPAIFCKKQDAVQDWGGIGYSASEVSRRDKFAAWD